MFCLELGDPAKKNAQGWCFCPSSACCSGLQLGGAPGGEDDDFVAIWHEDDDDDDDDDDDEQLWLWLRVLFLFSYELMRLMVMGL